MSRGCNPPWHRKLEETDAWEMVPVYDAWNFIDFLWIKFYGDFPSHPVGQTPLVSVPTDTSSSDTFPQSKVSNFLSPKQHQKTESVFHARFGSCPQRNTSAQRHSLRTRFECSRKCLPGFARGTYLRIDSLPPRLTSSGRTTAKSHSGSCGPMYLLKTTHSPTYTPTRRAGYRLLEMAHAREWESDSNSVIDRVCVGRWQCRRFAHRRSSFGSPEGICVVGAMKLQDRGKICRGTTGSITQVDYNLPMFFSTRILVHRDRIRANAPIMHSPL